MATITLTVNAALQRPQPILRLCSRAESASTGLVVLKNLSNILLKHSHNTDALSMRLFEQGHRFIILSKGNLNKPLREIISLAMEHIEKFRVILRHPFGEATLKEPWITPNLDLIWEKVELDRYQECLRECSRVPIEARPHEFAMDMLAWLNSLSIPSVPSSNLAIDHRERDMPIEAKKELKRYDKLIQNVLREIALQKEKERLDKEIAVEQRHLTVITARVEQDQQRFRLKCQEHLDAIRIALRAIEAEHQRTLDIVKTRLREAEASLQETQQDIRIAKQRIAALEANLSNLQMQYQNLAGQVSAMQNDDGGCVIC